MPSLIHNLDRDALLMLYLAGELSAEDHAEVDAMLARDPALRAAYEQMVGAQDLVLASLSAADAKLPLPAPVQSSVRRVGAAMDQWHIDQINARQEPVQRQRRKYGWVYSVAAIAAMIVVTVFILWSRVDDGKSDQIAKMMDRVNKFDDDSKNDLKNQNDGQPNGMGTNEVATNDAATNEAPADQVATNTDAATSETADTEPLLGTDPTDVQLSRVEVDLSTLTTLTDALRTTEDAVTP